MQSNKVEALYISKGLSGAEIADRLNLPIRQVYRILEKNNVQRRRSSESNNLGFLRKSPTFKIKTSMNDDERILLTAGIMLYWAEGWKDKKKNLLDFANSNPLMIKIYVSFLRNICGVREDKLRIYLYCYANQNPLKLKKFWSGVTMVPLSQFTKPYIRMDFQESKIGKMPHGLIHVRYADKKLFLQLEKWHEDIVRKWAGTEVVKPGTL
mgnify:CR=1 FL=1